MILELIHNATLLVTLVTVYRILLARMERGTLRFSLTVGVMGGFIAVIGMMSPLYIKPGLIVDGRSIILSTLGLISGPLATVIAAAIALAYRVPMGGVGVVSGVLSIISASALGILCYFLRERNTISTRPLTLWAFGVVVHLFILVALLTTLDGSGTAVVRAVGPTLLLAFPVVSMIVNLFLLDADIQYRDRKNLERSEKALKKAQAMAHMGSWIWYVQDDHILWSDEMYRIYGVDQATYTGSIKDILASAIHPDDREKVEAVNRAALNQGKAVPMEHRVIRPDGSTRVVWTEVGELVLDRKGKPLMLTGISQDITERQTVEEALRESELRYRNLIMHSPDAIFVNHNDRVVMVNVACVKLFGARNENDLLGKSPLELFHPDYHKEILERIDTMRRQNISVPVAEEKIIRLDNMVVDVDVISAPFPFRGTNDIHVIVRDITERKKMEEALRSSHDLLARLTEQVPGVVYQYRLFPDGSSAFPYSSQGMNDIYEYSPEEVREDATPVFGRLHPEDYDRVAADIFESARTLENFYCEFRVVLPRQGLRWRRSFARPERTEDGGTLWYGIILDVTESKLAEQQIHEQLDELRRWRSVMLGREKRMIELKMEVNDLLVSAGQPPRYPFEMEKKGSAVIYPHLPEKDRKHWNPSDGDVKDRR